MSDGEREKMKKSKAVRSRNRGSEPVPAKTVITAAPQGQATRETVESIVVAVVLAFLFRAFVAEAFVIPTGSMAPTLMGQHKDVVCDECGFQFRAGASIEIEEEADEQARLEFRHLMPQSSVVATTCPLCRHRMVLDLKDDADHSTFSGDRILVSKYIYDFTDPKRWDVIVFKYPFNAKQNFIKRLVGLPGEQLTIQRGDIFVLQPGESDYHVARKPDKKLLTMLQLVDDTKFRSPTLIKAGWPARWQPWRADGSDASGQCEVSDQRHSYHLTSDDDSDVWIRYHHIVPSKEDWDLIRTDQAPDNLSDRMGQPITDFYAYNAFTSIERFLIDDGTYRPDRQPEEYTTPTFGSPILRHFGTLGLHWVGDLAVETELEVESDKGQLNLLLVKGGIQFVCRIDLATGKATLTIDDGEIPLVSDDGSRRAKKSVGSTSIRGKGKYQLRFSNVDAELRLWVDGKRIAFDGPTTYEFRADLRPVWDPQELGDLAPLGVGARGADINVTRLRVLRDIYYVATRGGMRAHEYLLPYGEQRILETLQDPASWATTPLFASRDELHERLGSDQLYPMGDNSPQSSDARMWPEHFFSRRLLIGKALLIYWPHPWYRPVPYMPNFKRMRLIH